MKLTRTIVGSTALVALAAATLGAGLAGVTGRMPGVDHSAATAPVAVGPAVDAPPAVPSSAAVEASLAKLPVRFEANQGQADPEVAFIGRTGPTAATLFLTPGDSVLAVGDDHLRMSLVGADPRPVMEGVEPMAAVTNHFEGSDPDKWHTAVPNYAKVASRGVYPGIDLVHYGTGSQFEYDFVVSPGADPARIRLALAGAADLAVDGNGDLVATLAGSQVTHRRPIVYQEVGGSRVPVEGAYDLSGGTVGFRLGAYNHQLPLVIDPIVYTKFTGGSTNGAGGEHVYDMAVDAAGNLYAAGSTNDTDYPVVNNVDANASGEDAVVFKLDPSGTTLLYSTYLSGDLDRFGDEANDQAEGIEVDGSGFVYVSGSTGAIDFPTTAGAYHGPKTFVAIGNSTNGSNVYTTNVASFLASTDIRRPISGPGIAAGSRINAVNSPTSVTLNNNATATLSNQNFTLLPQGLDAFATKLSPTGSIAPVDGGYSTYLGMAGTAESIDTVNGRDVAIDGAGNAYVGGTATSPISGENLQFVLKLNAGGTGMIYTTYAAGNCSTQGSSIAVDSSNRAYLTGISCATNFPTPGGFQTTMAGVLDATLVRLDAAGTLDYGTYLGGTGNENSGSERASDVFVDAAGKVYVAGSTTSTNFPTTPGSLLPAAPGGGSDGFVMKLDLSLAPAGQVLWSTYLGGTGADSARMVVADTAGNVYVAGGTTSTNFPTASPVVGSLAGIGDAFVTKLNPTGSGLVYSTYIGGTSGENFRTSLAVGPDGSAYVGGQSQSTDFPAAPGQPSPALNGTRDQFVTKLTPAAAYRPADFNADGRTDLSTFRPSENVWYTKTAAGETGTYWGATGDVAVPGDYNGDGLADLATFRPSENVWYVKTATTETATYWGATNDIPVPADYDGDGKTDLATFRPSENVWYVKTATAETATYWGATNDIPVPADYNGDGKIDLATFRPSENVWYVKTAVGETGTYWGAGGDIPVPGDYDNDGRADLATFRPSENVWYVKTATAETGTYWGASGDIPVPGDYNRDGLTDLATFRPGENVWYVKTAAGETGTYWGATGDRPVVLPDVIRRVFF